MKSSLTSQQKKTLTYIIGTLLALGLAGGMVYDTNRRRAEASNLKQEVASKELEAASIQVSSEADQAQWAEKEAQLSSILLSDQAVPEFLEEVTRLANENQLVRLGINNEDKLLDPAQSTSPEETKLMAVGIRRYLLITLKFQSEYQDMARFLAGVSKLQRPVEFEIVDMRRNPPWVDVTVTLRVYKREAA